MRNFLLICLIGFSNLLIAQDWALFPFGQKSVYQSENYYISYIEVFTQDSIAGFKHYFNRKYEGDQSPNCTNALKSEYPNGNYLDSIIVKEDSTIYYYPGFDSIFYFLNNSEPGDFWLVKSDFETDGYSEIKITCIEKYVGSVIGTSDSLKKYSLRAIGIDEAIDPIINYEIILSKSFGLLEFIDLRHFLNHPDDGKFTTKKLIGCTNEEDTLGFIIPNWQNFFNYDTGDIRLWKFSNDPPSYMDPPYYEYYKDLITNVDRFPDSIILTYNTLRQDQYGNYNYTESIIEKYTKLGFSEFVSAPSFTFALGNNFIFNSGPNDISLWTNGYWQIDSALVETEITQTFGSAFVRLDTNTCEIIHGIGLGYGFTLHSFAGLTYRSNYFEVAGDGIISYRLIGYQIGDITWGELDFPTEINQLRKNEIELFPNPATNIIYTGITITHPLQYSIYNLQSQLIKNDVLTENTISVSDLTSGIYLLEIRDDENVYRGKFIVE
ncbi:MAG: T9SS type A sorting domain-containing protein [Bacteroidetes bacterium]|nr:T9SS type A sorting domain-containing protein [Bacteroidota bacterium]MBK8683067.1 T9SS type A sorting domain-containing protein [Bacteroidota bacterium]